jgi:hypothetical protein
MLLDGDSTPVHRLYVFGFRGAELGIKRSIGEYPIEIATRASRGSAFS